MPSQTQALSRHARRVKRARLTLLALLLTASSVTLGAAALSLGAKAALDHIEAGAKQSQSDSALVLVDGEPVLEFYAASPAPVLETMSVTKSVVALAVGALIGDGRIESLDTPVHTWFPEWKQGAKQAVTLRMLLDHSSGLQNVGDTRVEIYPAPDAVQLALAAELSHRPGTRTAYNNKAVNLLAGIIARASGEPMDAYIQRRLLDPIGASAGPWHRDASGNPYAMAGLSLDARGLAAIGQLVLQRGRVGDQQIVPEAYIETMLSPSPRDPSMGLLWWRPSAWVRFRADAESLAMIERAGAPREFTAKLRPLLGREFDSAESLYAALSAQLGAHWRREWQRLLIEPHGIGPWRPFHPEEGPVEAYEARGWLGQYLVVIPKAKLVAVRQIREQPTPGDGHDYADFGARAQALADALAND
jgi:CubicO group peptidase (beta-lactamase class C family)